MQWHGLKLPVIFLAFVCGLVLAFGGQWAYQKYNYQQPLNKMLAENNLVDEYMIEESANQTVVKVKLSKNANNLMTAYQEINYLTNKLMGKTPYRIELVSAPDASLEQAFDECQFVIYQAQIAANFPEVASLVTAAASRQGASGKVFVDENFIYIQLTKPDGHFLHKVIPRQIPAQVVIWQGGAGIVKRN
ncbi:hypothetical protein [Desulforamulus hydrothermalis]|uniref:Uncharacterized protein n=1 Tax=Desulforamulus hydrothermalis Lam5 = DSM 18033 TaxID=1121428 RepID=K8E123_9FIRM|nr:hypothetical protein [Desulforamulus hydrothermalis]CCO09392.1 conserved hypothetical protein [Desulforamulus hydrothermalis Lam5 = DSM 18033]SHH09104.1 hypothetical protein SAMN02745177_01413 [Desulforamulus hydrothermalis Lam5 = DSM 18033]